MMNENTKKGITFGVFAVIGYLLMDFYRTTQENNALKASLLNKPQSEVEDTGGGGGGGGGSYMPMLDHSTVPVVVVPIYGRTNYGRIAAAYGPNAPKMKVVDRKVKNIVKGYEPPISGLTPQVTSPATPVSANATSSNLAPAAETPKNAALTSAVASPVVANNSITSNATGGQWAFDCGCQ